MVPYNSAAGERTLLLPGPSIVQAVKGVLWDQGRWSLNVFVDTASHYLLWELMNKPTIWNSGQDCARKKQIQPSWCPGKIF
jgi:hypothetical protein